MAVISGSYQTPLEVKQRADEGDVTACLATGNYYRQGYLEYDIPRDPGMACAYYERGMHGGQLDCQRRLAEAYATGSGVRQDMEKSLQLLTEAAEHGDLLSHAALGRYYIRSDPGRAQGDFTRFHLALLNDMAHADIMIKLGRDALYYPLCLMFGTGCRQNPEKALEALKALAAAEFSAAKYALMKNYIDDWAMVSVFAPGQKRIDLAPVTGHPAEDTPGARHAAELDLQLRIIEGDPAAFLQMGEKMAAGGRGFPADPKTAAEYYEKGMHSLPPGNEMALECQYRLAEAYLAGKGVPQNRDRGLALLKDAAEKGHAGAQSAVQAA